MLLQKEKTEVKEKSFTPETSEFYSTGPVKTSRSLNKHKQKASETSRKSQATKKNKCAEDDLLVKTVYKLKHCEQELTCTL